MKKALILLLSILVILPAILCASSYGYIRYRYYNTFMPGTFINGVYAAEKAPSQMNKELMNTVVAPEVLIKNRAGEEFCFSMQEADYSSSFLGELNELQQNQSIWKYINWFFETDNSCMEYQIEPVGTYNPNKLEDYLKDLSFLKDNSSKLNRKVEIRHSVNGYYLYDETKNLLNKEKAVMAVLDAVSQNRYHINLYNSNCYESIRYTDEMLSVFSIWKQVSRIQNTNIVYHFGEVERTVGKNTVSKWICLDENNEILLDGNGRISLDEEQIEEYVENLADEFDTVSKPRKFLSTRGDLITVEKGNYGSKLDEKKEVSYLSDAAKNGRRESHTPIYSQMPYPADFNGTDDIGDTYIEVDMTNQTMYYYENGSLMLETPVVTGNTSLSNGTPVKVCYVYYKQKNRILRGEDYAVPVSYWIAVYGRIGIHDASWRSKFGGTIYKSAGSHGCINTPTKAVGQLYDMVEIGTPVVIFY